MVQLTNICNGQMRTFGWRMSPYRSVRHKNKIWNHRKPLKYQRFMSDIDPEEIVSHYSRDDIDQLDPREGRRTYRDAQQTMGRRNYLLPDLSDRELEVNEIFQSELDRQRAIVARVDKIRVVVDSQPGKETELIMNKDLSTPYDCARHIHELLTTRSVVAELKLLEEVSPSSDETKTDNDVPLHEVQNTTNTGSVTQVTRPKPIYWDMHRPLKDDCKILFRHFTDRGLAELNKIYWRSCSFVLGMAIRQAFKDDIKVLLHSWPRPNVKSGSFVYDVALNLSEKWHPTENELRALTKLMWDIRSLALPFERLQVDRDLAKKLFSDNPFKTAQIDSVLADESSHGKVTVYRCGGLLDMSVGPMISNTEQIGRISLAAVHPFDSRSDAFKGVFYRFQGVSIPQQLPLSSYLYQNIILNNAKKFNKVAL